MNLQSFRTVFLSCLILFILGCHKDKVEDITGGTGEESSGVSLRLKTDMALNVVALTRAGETPADEDFSVRIENTKGEVLRTWKYNDVPSLIKVVPGAYKLVGWYGADTVLPAFAAPYYYGETKITLKEGDNLDTVVNCSLAAVKVAVEFDESFGYEYADYSVDVKTAGDSLRFEKGEGRAAYFKPGNLRLRFLLNPLGSETWYEFYPPAIGTVKAKQFYKMKLKANTDKGALKSITVTTDSSTIDIPVEVELPPFYLPKAAPKVTPQGFVSGDVVETTEGLSKKATVLVTSAGGLTELRVKTVSDTLIARGWPAEVDLMNATAEQLSVLKNNGLEWSDVLTQQDTVKTTVFVRFDNVVKLLNTAPGNTAASMFEVVVKDRFKQAGDAECKLNVSVAPPVFGFKDGTPVEGNMFARKAEFDLVYTADRDNYKPMLQFKTLGGTWQNAMEVLDGEVGERMAKVGGLTSLNNYVFRAVLREHAGNEFQLMTEAELQVPNAGMENWYSVGGTKNRWYYWYPWSQSDATSQGWNTINLKTIGDGWNYQYNSISGTMSTGDKHSGNSAALIRTVGWGKGNSALGSANASNIDPGYLYLGVYDAGTKAPDYGYSFASRPSAFSCYYKYTTKDDRFLAEIVVQHREGDNIVELGRGSWRDGTNVGAYTKLVVPVAYNKENKNLKATHIYIVFKSGDKTDNSTLMEVPPFANLSTGKYVGSQLYIDDVELTYE